MEMTLFDKRGGGKSYTKKITLLFQQRACFRSKIHDKEALNVEVVGRNFKPLWRARKDFKTREVGDHVLLFVFELETDVE